MIEEFRQDLHEHLRVVNNLMERSKHSEEDEQKLANAYGQLQGAFAELCVRKISYENWASIFDLRKRVKRLKPEEAANPKLVKLRELLTSEAVTAAKQAQDDEFENALREAGIQSGRLRISDFVEISREETPSKVTQFEGFCFIEEYDGGSSTEPQLASSVDSNNAAILPIGSQPKPFPMNDLLKRIAAEKKEIPKAHLEALEKRHTQISKIGNQFLADFGPMLLDGSVSIVSEILAHPAKRAELSEYALALFPSIYDLIPTDLFGAEALKQFNEISTRWVHAFTKLNLSLVKELLNGQATGPCLLAAAMEYITPMCFKQPAKNIDFQRKTTLASFQGLTLFIKHLNASLEDHEVHIENERELFNKMHGFYAAKFGRPLLNRDKTYTTEGIQWSIRGDIREILTIMLTSQAASTDLKTQMMVALIPFIAESFISRLITPHTLYSLVLRLFNMYEKKAEIVEDPLQPLCRDPIFREFGDGPEPDPQFAEELGDVLFCAVVEALKLPNFTALSTIVEWLETFIKPKLVLCAKDIDNNLLQMGSSVCLYLPFDILNKTCYDQGDGKEIPAAEVTAVLKMTAEEKAEDLTAVEEQMRATIDIKRIIEDEISKNSYMITGWFKKKVVPSTEISQKMPPLLAQLAKHPALMYMMVGYMLNSVRVQLEKSPNG